VSAPGGPGDGTHPAQLPLTVEPATGLEDGATVTVSGSGFTPGVDVGIVLCAREARGGGGVAWCDTSVLTSTRVSSEGYFSRPFVIRRWITTSRTGDLDCGEPADRCAIAAGNVRDYDEAGGSDITFSPAPAPPGPELTVTPDGPYRDFQEVEVRGRRFAADDDLSIRQCPAEVGPGGPTDGCVDALAPARTVGGDGTFVDRLRLRRVLPSMTSGDHDCARVACVLRMRSNSGRSAGFTLSFDPKAAWAPDPTAALETTYPIHDGDRITVVGHGLLPGERVRVFQCAVELPCARPDGVAVDTVDSSGRFSVRSRYREQLGVSDGEPVRCPPGPDPHCFFRVERDKGWPIDVPIRVDGPTPGR
jgi:hypothetical protein